jgi:hypothetical protein
MPWRRLFLPALLLLLCGGLLHAQSSGDSPNPPSGGGSQPDNPLANPPPPSLLWLDVTDPSHVTITVSFEGGNIPSGTTLLTGIALEGFFGTASSPAVSVVSSTLGFELDSSQIFSEAEAVSLTGPSADLRLFGPSDAVMAFSRSEDGLGVIGTMVLDLTGSALPAAGSSGNIVSGDGSFIDVGMLLPIAKWYVYDAVPQPPTAWLLGFGLASLFFLRRRIVRAA